MENRLIVWDYVFIRTISELSTLEIYHDRTELMDEAVKIADLAKERRDYEINGKRITD